jgi:histidinol-phosphate aminotransferase
LKVPIYIAGKSIEEVQAEMGLDEIIKLASNESPVGPSPKAIRAAQKMLEKAHRYPGVVDRELRCNMATRLGPGLDQYNIVLGNGGTDVLRMITQAFVFDGGNTIMSRATFPMYRILTTTFGGTVRFVEMRHDYRHDLDATVDLIDDDTRIVFLCSPNNPTGRIITQAEADAFMAQVPAHVIVVFDEAYYDYVTDPEYANSVAYIKEGRNVLSVRSFSKTAGLANMRVGYLVGPAELADYICHTRLPFHIGDIALASASASLDDEVYRVRHLKTMLEGRAFLESAMREMKLNCLSSQANFVTFINPPLEPDTLVEGLLRRGIIVRGMAPFGMANAVRVSVGSPDDNQKFIEALQQVLDSSRTEAAS